MGTKSDLVEKRMISSEQVKGFIKNNPDYGIDGYFETSAKSNINVEELFTTAATLVLDRVASFTCTKTSPKSKKGVKVEKVADPRQSLITGLENYINRIEKHVKLEVDNEFNKNPDFAYGFWHHKDSRAINREANYLLAKNLLSRLKNSYEPIKSIFKNIESQRDNIIEVNKLCRRDYYTRRPCTNSNELKKVIENANLFADSEQPSPQMGNGG